MALTDTDIIGWGKYPQTPLRDIPAEYLVWCHNNIRRNSHTRLLLDYIKLNWGTIQRELKENEVGRAKAFLKGLGIHEIESSHPFISDKEGVYSLVDLLVLYKNPS